MRRIRGFCVWAILCTASWCTAFGEDKFEFFESRIRPVLVEHCYACHNSAKNAEGGLAVDSRDALLRGGDGGRIVMPGKPGESRLLAILRHQVDGLRMPQGANRLDDAVIADFERWIRSGAPDPRDRPPSEAELEKTTSWESVRQRRMQWWSFQPIRETLPPRSDADGADDWALGAVDSFVLDGQRRHGLRPAPAATVTTLLRRLHFTLTGLPPEPAEVAEFAADAAAAADAATPDAYERLVDRLLASPRFGERWARHWMDLVRYCESHGSQGDPELPNAWRYRDYLIRAFNQDVPYDQFVREQLAGDLLEEPRLDATNQLNESALGIAQLRMSEYGYIPVDALDDQVKVVDNQIDVVSKTFLGLTVSCARCHDHKFDPIAQRDFYAWYGIFASCRPGQIVVDSPDRQTLHRAELARLKQVIRARLAEAWMATAERLAERLQASARRDSARRELATNLRQLDEQIGLLEGPARDAVLKARGTFGVGDVPRPMARWSFNGDARDGVGSLHGTVAGDAKFRDGRLVLNGTNVRVRTEPLPKDLAEKTLEVWTTLANLDQRAVGVLTIESGEGDRFDSIVYAEQVERKWMPGSDFFRRTRQPEGPVEQAAPNSLVHLAIVYRPDNRIAMYREGKPYGEPYVHGTLQTFPAGHGRVLIGQRHPAPQIPYFAGELDEARLYDRALTSEQIAASFAAGPEGVRREELLAALAPDQAKRLEEFEQRRRTLSDRLRALDLATEPFAAVLDDARRNPRNPFRWWTELADSPESELFTRWNRQVAKLDEDRARSLAARAAVVSRRWDLASDDVSRWHRAGTGAATANSPAGQFEIERDGDRIVRGVLPAGVHTHLLTRKDVGVLTSPRFVIDTKFASVRAIGRKADVRLVIENYPLGGGAIYPAARLDRDAMEWSRMDLTYRKGSHAYFEFRTDDDDQAYFGAAEVVLHDQELPSDDDTASLRAIARQAAPGSVDELNVRYAAALRAAIAAFRAESMNAEDVSLLDFFVRQGLLPVTFKDVPELRDPVESYRRLEREIPRPRRGAGVFEAEAFDQPMFERGRHTQPGTPVPRGYLEAFGGRPYRGRDSGRLALAEDLVSLDNPLVARVMVNRLWHHVFGRGLVASVDNFGRLGDQPTHPELLDHLAWRFPRDRAWSIKRTLRDLVTSRTYRQSAVVSESARRDDGRNLWLSHMPVRRLEAEAIRDSLLAVSGQLNHAAFGPGVNVFYVGKAEGASPPGPLDGDRRRSVYLRVRRNSFHPLLATFDAPQPSSTRGRRDVTNVPAHSLALLNDPLVSDQAAKWARSLVADGRTPDERIRSMFVAALAREPNAEELAASRAYLAEAAADVAAGEKRGSLADLPGAWQEFAQSLFSLKEFLYVE